jgi:hypothetical protein
MRDKNKPRYVISISGLKNISAIPLASPASGGVSHPNVNLRTDGDFSAVSFVFLCVYILSGMAIQKPVFCWFALEYFVPS